MCFKASWSQSTRSSEWPSCEGWEQLVLAEMAAGTLLLFFLVTSLGIFIPVTSPLGVSWGFLILMQGLPHYTRPGSLQWEQEEKHVI